MHENNVKNWCDLRASVVYVMFEMLAFNGIFK